MKFDLRGMHADRACGAILFAAALFLLIVAWELPFGHLNAPDSGFLPIVLSILLMLMSAAIFIGASWSAAPSTGFSSRSWAVPTAAVALLLYAVLLDRIGFLICTFAILMLFLKAYGRLTWSRALLIATPLVLVTYFSFKELGVPLPNGVFSLI